MLMPRSSRAHARIATDSARSHRHPRVSPLPGVNFGNTPLAIAFVRWLKGVREDAAVSVVEATDGGLDGRRGIAHIASAPRVRGTRDLRKACNGRLHRAGRR